MSRRLRRLRWTWGSLALLALLGAWAVLWSARSRRPEVHVPGEEIPGITQRLSREVPEGAPHPAFTDVTGQAGIDFLSFVGPRTSQLPEDMGSGAAWGDFDNDGDDDLFLVSAGGSLDLPAAERGRSELYENRGDGTFRRVEGFPEIRIIGMGAAWGDVDGDGWEDLVVTGYRSLLLLRNREGRMVRDDAFPSPDGYWAGASWGDFDNDRDLDLYVCGYVRYREEEADLARASLQYGKSVPYTLNPSSYSPERNLLLRNRGDGTFTEVAGEAGVANPEGRSLGALWHDVDGDGWLDLYVANDISDNMLFHNRGGTFEDISHAAWVAENRGAMGLAVGDWNGDGDDDLFVTHWVAQENALYDSLLVDLRGAPPGPSTGGLSATAGGEGASLRFMDVADERGLGQSALPTVGWGTDFADLDADGWLDLLVSNGSTFETEDDPPLLQPQRLFLFWNREGDGFHDLSTLNPALSEPHVGRGLAVSDYDLDGDLDFVTVHHSEGARLWRNDMETGRWIKLHLRSRAGSWTGRGVGAVLEATVGGRTLRRAVTGVSYLSQSSRVVHFGLGTAAAIDELQVHWPGGGTDRYRDLAAGRTWEIAEGDAEPRPVQVAASPPEAPLDRRQRQVAFWESQRAAVRAMKQDGDLEGAAALFRRALELDPTHEDSLYYLGHCQAGMGDVDGALDSFRALTRANPSSHRGYRQWAVLRAATARSAADLEAAAASLHRALEINPEETGVLLALAEVEILQGREADARQRLEWACRSNPRAVGGYFLLGYLGWKDGDPALAGDRLAAALEARGPEWKPEGSVAEGDVQTAMHRESGVLARFWESWDGALEPHEAIFQPLDAHLAARRRELGAGGSLPSGAGP